MQNWSKYQETVGLLGHKEERRMHVYFQLKEGPNTNVKSTLTTKHQTLDLCFHLQCHDREEQEAGAETIAEGVCGGGSVLAPRG